MTGRPIAYAVDVRIEGRCEVAMSAIGPKRTLPCALQMSAYDPERTLGSHSASL